MSVSPAPIAVFITVIRFFWASVGVGKLMEAEAIVSKMKISREFCVDSIFFLRIL
jgi:hypothetical protein